MLQSRERFTELYNESFEYVYSYLFARTAGNRLLTEEMVQETFAAAWSSFGRFDQRSAFRTWLCAIAKNKLREYYRRSIRWVWFARPLVDGRVGVAGDFDLEEAALCHETRLRVLDALGELPPPCRYALIMKYLDGLSVKEIAKVLDKSPKAVDGLLQRAKARFGKVYLGEGCDNHE